MIQRMKSAGVGLTAASMCCAGVWTLHGFKFCWIRDTPGIDDESNLNFYHEETIREQKMQVFNKVVTVNCADGSHATGKVYHWVNGFSYNCSLKYWFILCTERLNLFFALYFHY